MAQDPRQEKSLSQLRQEIAHSRDRLARDLTGMRYELNFPLKFRKSFQRKTGPWITIAAVVGVLFSLLPMRTKKIYIGGKKKDDAPKKMMEAGVALGALKIVANLLKPLVISFVTKKFASYSGGRGRGRP